MVEKRKDVNPSEGEDKYGDVKYADPKNKKYPIDTEEHIRAAWDYIHKAKDAGKYSPEDVKAIKAHIVAAWKDKIDKAGPPEAKMSKGTDDLQNTMLHGVEIFEAGKWPGSGVNGYRFTTKDIQDIVASFSALDLSGRVPIKLGHDDTNYMNDGAPALGWVERVWSDGDKLMADITLVSPKLARLIEARAYKFVSVELLRDVQADTRKIPWVLDAVALLGASQPAVGVLKDLQASLRMAKGSGLLSGLRCAFRREFARIEEVNDMTPEEVSTAIADAIKPIQAQLAASEARAKAAETEAAKAKLSAHRASIVAVFEQAIAAGTILPAAREKFSKTYGVDDDEKVMKLSASDAKEFIEGAKDMPQFRGDGKSTGPKGRITFGRDEVDTSGKTAGDIVTELTELQMQADGVKAGDYEGKTRAYFKVLRKYPDIAKAYINGQAEWNEPFKAAA